MRCGWRRRVGRLRPCWRRFDKAERAVSRCTATCTCPLIACVDGAHGAKSNIKKKERE